MSVNSQKKKKKSRGTFLSLPKSLSVFRHLLFVHCAV